MFIFSRGGHFDCLDVKAGSYYRFPDRSIASFSEFPSSPNSRFADPRNAFEPEAAEMPDFGPPDEDVCSAVESSTAPSSESRKAPTGHANAGGESLVPLGDVQASQVLAAPGGSTSKADVVAFDELFQKFCGAGGSNQFAYFEECWSKPGRGKAGKASSALADAQEGALAAVPEKEGREAKERQPKRPLFDLANLDKPAKPIETEPVAKHQLNERATQWQLRKDVPPCLEWNSQAVSKSQHVGMGCGNCYMLVAKQRQKHIPTYIWLLYIHTYIHTCMQYYVSSCTYYITNNIT